MPGCNTEPLGISSRSYLPPLLNVYGMKTCAHIHTCTCVQHSEHMWRPEVNVRCLLYSPPPLLPSFKKKALPWSASTAGMERHCSRRLRGGQSQEDRAVGPSSEQLQVVSQKLPIHWGRAYSSQLRAAWRTSQVCDSRLDLLLPSFLPGSHSAIRIWLCQSLSFISGKERNLECDRNQELGLWIQILLTSCECPFHC